MTKASPIRDPFVRPVQPGGGAGAAFGMASDQFREQAALKAARTIAMKPDAFAAKKAPAIPNPFDPKPREAAMRPERVTEAVNVRPVVVPRPPKPRLVANNDAARAPAPQSMSMEDIRAEFEEKVRLSKPVRRAPFVLVPATAMAAGAAAASAGAQGEASGAGRQTRGRSGSGGGGGRKPPNIDRAFNQDDLVAILIVLALLLMLGLYFIRDNGGGQPQQLASTVAADPVVQPQAAPAAPVPLKDPFGDQPLNLAPKAAPPPPEVAVAPTPAPAPACAAGHTMRAFFCTDRSDLTDKSKLALEKELADWSACFKDRELVVTGYADTRGPNVYNTYLGETRARSVADFLKSRGIKVAQLTGVGELEGLADNENCSNQRRVDISFAGESGEPNRSCAPPEDVAALVCG